MIQPTKHHKYFSNKEDSLDIFGQDNIALVRVGHVGVCMVWQGGLGYGGACRVVWVRGG